MAPSPSPGDPLLALVLMVVWTFAGAGLLQTLRVRIDPGLRLLLGPLMTQAAWALVLAISVGAGTPVRTSAPALAGATLLAAGYGFVGRPRRARDAPDASIDSYRLLAIAGLATTLVLLPWFVYGFRAYPGSAAPDGWSYAAYGQYLWTHPKGVEGALPLLHQYAAHLANTRHVASAALAALSLLTSPGDPQTAIPLLFTVSVFSLATACAAVGRAYFDHPVAHVTFVAMTVVNGWTLNVLGMNNFDNLVALAFFPWLAALLRTLALDDRGGWAVVALVMAALIHTYPEMGLPVSGIVMVLALERWLTAHRNAARYTGQAASIAIALAVFALLVAPFASQVATFFARQTATGVPRQTVRPAEGAFAGLLSWALGPSAFWALGGELGEARLLAPRTLVAAALFGLTAIGVWRFVRERRVGLLAAVALPIAGSAFFAFAQHYSYGTYKAILAGWWALALAVVSGASRLADLRRGRSLVALATILVCLAPSVFAVARIARALLRPPPTSMAEMRALESLPQRVGRRPIGVFVADANAAHWAVYYLREAPVRLGTFSGYLAWPHVRPFLARSRGVPWTDVRLVLTDREDRGAVGEAASRGWTLMWENGAYRLWDTAGHLPAPP